MFAISCGKTVMSTISNVMLVVMSMIASQILTFMHLQKIQNLENDFILQIDKYILHQGL